MNCIRCGRETPGDACFCEECQLDMERYPVKPGTVVQLPPRRETPPQRKAPRRRAVPLEEQVKVLKKRLRTVTICMVILLLLCALLVYPAVQYAMEDHFVIGQNYSSVTNPAAFTDSNK